MLLAWQFQWDRKPACPREVETGSCLGLSPTTGSWRGAQTGESSRQAGADGLAEELGSSGHLHISFGGHSHPRSGSRASYGLWEWGWDKHGSKRNFCHRKNGHKSPIMVLTTPCVGGGGSKNRR